MTLRVERDASTGVAVVTLDREHRHNAIDLETAAELSAVWREFRFDDAVRAVVLTGAGTAAFCTGIDRGVDVPQPGSPYSVDDPLVAIGPKAADLWKPVIAAEVIGDFRPPDVIRFGLTPLYLGFEDIWTGVDRLAAIMDKETWRDPRFAVRGKVT